MDQIDQSRACRAATGTGSRMAASSATCARAIASCTKASAACASCARARTTRSCSRPMAARPASASIRSRRSRSTISCPARRCCRSAPPAATSPASSARTGTSRRRARSTALQDRASPGGDRRGGGAQRLPLGRVHLQRSGDLPRIRGRRGAGLPRARRQDGGGERGLHLRRSRGANSSGTWTPPTSTSRASPRASTSNLCSGRLAPVLETLEYLKHETEVWFEITTLLDPRRERLARRDRGAERVGDGASRPRRAAALHGLSSGLEDAATRRRRRRETLRTARRIALAAGLRYVYTGNIHDPAGQSTYCHACGALLIGRDWYDLTAWTLTPDGRCRTCGSACAGVFENEPGRWGRRRRAVVVPELAAKTGAAAGADQ